MEYIPKYYQQKIAVIGKWRYCIPYRRAIAKYIAEFGFQCFEAEEIEDALKQEPTCAIVICPQIYEIPKDRNVLWAMIQLEQLYSKDIGGNQFCKNRLKQIVPYLKAYDLIFDISSENVQTLRKMTDKKVTYLPYAYFSELEYPIDLKQPKKYDLLFIGNMPGTDGRREKLIQQLQKKYSMYPQTKELWWEKKAEAINECKICLNIHFDEARFFETMRFCDYFSHHGFLLTEQVHSTEPFKNGEDYVSYFWTDLEQKIDYYLAHDEEREQIANHAYETLKKHSLKDSVNIMMSDIILEAHQRQTAQDNKLTVLQKAKRKIYSHIKK